MTNATHIEERALHARIRKSTVRLLDFTDKSKAGPGVTVQLENRFFVATGAKASERWARGTQIKLWLDLVVRNCPDLAQIASQLR